MTGISEQGSCQGHGIKHVQQKHQWTNQKACEQKNWAQFKKYTYNAVFYIISAKKSDVKYNPKSVKDQQILSHYNG